MARLGFPFLEELSDEDTLLKQRNAETSGSWVDP